MFSTQSKFAGAFVSFFPVKCYLPLAIPNVAAAIVEPPMLLQSFARYYALTGARFLNISPFLPSL